MDDLNTLLEELSSFGTKQPPQYSSNHPQPADKVPTEDELTDYILKKANALVDASLTSVEELKPYVIQGCNPDEVAALAELINASTKALETVLKINQQKKKFDNDIKLKQIDYELKKELVNTTQSGPTTINNNVFLASREEVFKKYLNDATIDVVLDEDKTTL